MTPFPSTQSLIERIQHGDVAARELLYDRCLLPVLFLVRVQLGRKLRAKLESWDIVQETLIRSLNDLEHFHNERSDGFQRYLANKVDQVIRDHADYWSAAKRDASRDHTGGTWSSQPTVDGIIDHRYSKTPSELMSLNEDLSQLAEAMDVLAEQSRDDWDLVVAVKLIGSSLHEVASARNISVDAAKMRTRRALVKLAKIIQQQQALRERAPRKDSTASTPSRIQGDVDGVGA